MKTDYHLSLGTLRRSLLRAAFAALLGAVALATPLFSACHREPVARTPGEEQADDRLGQEVKASFSKSPSFKFPDVEVAAYKGRIQLSGFVVSEDQKKSAEEMAKEVQGVKSVENKISLKK